MSWRPEGWQAGKDEWFRHSAHSKLSDGSVYEAGADGILGAIGEEIEGAINLLVGNVAGKDMAKAEILSDQLQPLRQSLDALKDKFLKPKE